MGESGEPLREAAEPAFSTILVPLDGTAEAAAALPPAQALAGATGASLFLLRVTPEGHGRETVDVAAEAEAALERIAAELRAGGVAAEATVKRGDPGERIVDQVEQANVGLVVMATHGRAGLSRAVLGSVAQHVVGHSRTPVILLRPGGHRMTRLRTLLVPVDGSPGGALATGAALGLARATGARLVLLEVVVPIPAAVYGGDVWLGAAGGYYVYPELDEERLAAARGYVGGMAERLRRAGVAAEGRALPGLVVPTVESVADEVDADLIVMSTHALTGPIRTILGSVADAVVRTSHRPVLLVRRDQARGDTSAGGAITRLGSTPRTRSRRSALVASNPTDGT